MAELDDVVPVCFEIYELRSLGSLETTDRSAQPGSRHGRSRNWLFVWSVAVPVAIAALYLFGVAADRYRSEARFIVRATGVDSELALSGGMAEAGGSRLSRVSEDAFIVNEYITSRDALDRLVEERHFEDMLSRPEADVFSRFPSVFQGASKERLFQRYRSLVESDVDETSGISTIKVTAFRSEDAQALTRSLLDYAESVVNRINDRANRDRVAFAARGVERAKGAVTAAEAALTDFRTTSGIVDPRSEYKVALQGIGHLTTEASQQEAALDQRRALTPGAPAIASMREMVRSLRAEIARQNQLISGGRDSLAVKFGRFEQLTLDREIAIKELVSAVGAYEASLQAAGEQQLYLQIVAEPNGPDQPYAPRRFSLMILVIACCAGLYLTLRTLKGIGEEHAA